MKSDGVQQPNLDINSRHDLRLAVNILACLLTCSYLFFVAKLVLATPGTDFTIYYNALVLFRDSGNPYDVPAYTYSPLFVQLLRPLAFFSQAQARLIWFVLQVSSLAVLILLCIRASGSRYAQQYWGTVILCTFVATPTYLDLVLGQVGIFVAVLVIASYVMARQRPSLASLLLSFTIVIKLYSALLWFAFVQIRRWKIVYTIVLCCLLLVLASMIISGVNIYLDFARKLPQDAAHPYTAEHNNSIIGFWLRMFTINPFVRQIAQLPLLAYILIGLSTIAIFTISLVIGRRSAGEVGELVTFSIWICAMSLITPVNGIYNLMILLLPILTLMRVNETERLASDRRWLLVAIMLLYVPLMSSIYTIPELQSNSWVALYFTPPVYGLIILFVLLIRAAQRSQFQQRDEAKLRS